MKLLFLCSSLEPGRDGVGDYTRRLACECVRQGHEVRLVALNEKAEGKNLTADPCPPTSDQLLPFPFQLFTFLDCQESEGTSVSCLRLPGSLAWEERIGLAAQFLNWFSPDWISLQFVPYGFQPKGLPLGLAKRLQRLIGAIPLHLMFHELWIGSARSSPWPHRPVGFLQRWCIRHLLRQLQPRVIHTSIPVYQAMLKQIGTAATVFPLFGNVPVAAPDPDYPLPPELATLGLNPFVEDSTIWIGILFGTIYPEWEPLPLLTQLRATAAKQGRKLVLISVGKAGSYGEKLMDRIRQAFPEITCLTLGSHSEKTISLLLQSASFGLATTPWQLIGKSSTVATLLDHGLPVIVTRDDWQLREKQLQIQSNPSGLFSPKEFSRLAILPVRDAEPPGNRSIKRVAQQMLQSMALSTVGRPGYEAIQCTKIAPHNQHHMKILIKETLEKFSPKLRWAMTSYKNRVLCKKRFGRFQKEIRGKIYAGSEPVVLSGPFAGLHYIDEIVWGPITPKWLGTYEAELHSAINAILSGAKYKMIIDVGAAEGYYAVALAKHFPNSMVFTFDLDFRARRQQRRLASLNQVSNLIIGFSCDPNKLQLLIEAHACLVICDIEGFETELLNPDSVPALRFVDILVEVHPARGMSLSDVRDLLRGRFSGSHQIETIDSVPREVMDFRYPLPNKIASEDILRAMDEGRNGQQCWLWMIHRS